MDDSSEFLDAAVSYGQLSQNVCNRCIHERLVHAEQLLEHSVKSLVSRMNISLEDATLLRFRAAQFRYGGAATALLYVRSARTKDVSACHFSFGCPEIDSLLYGGRGCVSGRLTQLVGVSATAKTQLCLSLVASIVTHPHHHSVAFVDCGGAVDVSRIKQLIEAKCNTHTHLQIIDTNAMLSRIRLYRAFTALNALDIVEQIEADLIAQEHTFAFDLRAVVIDSPADVLSTLDNTTSLLLRHSIGSAFRRLCVEHELVVVITNRVSRSSFGSERLYCGLGELWSHMADQSLIIHRDAAKPGTLFIAQRFHREWDEQSTSDAVLFEIGNSGPMHVDAHRRHEIADIPIMPQRISRNNKRLRE